MLATLLMEHVKKYDFLPEEQKALKKGTRGCLDALVIDEAVARETRLFGRNLSLGWVDYRKAYDMVPHLWIRKMMKAIRTPPPLRRAIKHLIPLWETEIAQYTTEGMRSARIGGLPREAPSRHSCSVWKEIIKQQYPISTPPPPHAAASNEVKFIHNEMSIVC